MRLNVGVCGPCRPAQHIQTDMSVFRSFRNDFRLVGVIKRVFIFFALCGMAVVFLAFGGIATVSCSVARLGTGRGGQGCVHPLRTLVAWWWIFRV